MTNWNMILLILLLVYQTVASIMDLRDMRKYKKIKITEKVKLSFYKETIVWGWVPALIVFAFVFFLKLSLDDIGIRKMMFGDIIWLNVITLIISLIILCILLYQVYLYFTNTAYRKQMQEELDIRKKSSNYYNRVTASLVVPYTVREKRYFFFVSLTAGICEELVWRGCILFLLAELFPALHFVVIGGIACLLFGLFHCYQGWYGILKTSIIAVLFVLIYQTTGSLLLGMLLHFLFDFVSAFLVGKE